MTGEALSPLTAHPCIQPIFGLALKPHDLKKDVIISRVFHVLSYSSAEPEPMDKGGGLLELHSQDLKMPHAMIMQDFGKEAI